MLRVRIDCKCWFWAYQINKRVKQSTSRSRPILRPVSSYNVSSVIQWLIVHSSVLPKVQCWPGDQFLWAVPRDQGLPGVSSQWYGNILTLKGMVFSHIGHKFRVLNLAISFIKRVCFLYFSLELYRYVV